MILTALPGLFCAAAFAALVKGQTRLGDVNNSFAIGPIINIPLFDWGQRRAVRDAREDELQAAVLAYRQAVLQGAARTARSVAPVLVLVCLVVAAATAMSARRDRAWRVAPGTHAPSVLLAAARATRAPPAARR